MTETPADFKSGFIAIAGAPNVGKSTLLNRMLGMKISITSKKPQTTRNRILGVLHRPGSQMVFVDTPGIHRAGKQLNVRIVDTALAAVGDADLILLVVDAANPDPESEALLLRRLQSRKDSVVLALNKIDRVDKPTLLGQMASWTRRREFLAIVPISALEGTQVDALVEAMAQRLPPGPPLFPEDAVTDLPMRFLAAEIVREKVFRFTGEEVPYAAAVTVDEYAEPAAGAVRIRATVHLERDSQKGIVIGKGGAKLKQIGEAARKEIEALTGQKVVLKLFVRVQKNWSRDGRALRRFGY